MKYVPPVGGAVNDPYVDANPGTGVEGSPVPAAAIEHPMREMQAVIQAAGLTPSTIDLTQLLQSLPGALASRPEMARSLSANGYQKFPGGLIIQWGYRTTSSGEGAVTFPVAFPNAVFVVVAADQTSGTYATVDGTGVSSPTLTGFNLSTKAITSGAAGSSASFWIAIGN